METVNIVVPAALLKAANLEEANLSEEATRLLALELYREDKVSLGRAAELCQTPLSDFMDFVASMVYLLCATVLKNLKKNAGRASASAGDRRCLLPVVLAQAIRNRELYTPFQTLKVFNSSSCRSF